MANGLGFDSLDSAKYLYLRKLSEPQDNSLRLVVQEAVVNPAGSARLSHPELPELEEILRGSSPIESTDACRTFELTWKRYVAYLVTEECVGSCGQYADEICTGKLLRVYTKSHFLEHLSRDTGGHTEAILHYKLTCLNHLIDVAAYAPQRLRRLGQSRSPQREAGSTAVDLKRRSVLPCGDVLWKYGLVEDDAMLFTAIRHFPLQFLAFLIASMFCVSAGPPGSAGLRIKTIRRNTSSPVETNPRTEEQILYFQGNRRRTEWKGESRHPLWPGGPEVPFYGPHSALIEICEAEAKKAFSLNLDNRTYAPVTLQQKLSTDQLKAIRVSQAETPSRPTVLHEITTLDRGERKQAFGYTARHVITTFKVTPQQGAADVTPQESITDGWYIDLNTRVSCDPPGKTPSEGTTYSVVQLMGTVSSTNPASISTTNPCLVETRYVGKPETGFPISLKTTRFSGSAQGLQTEQVSTHEIEVTDLSATNLDSSLFEVPPDFRIVTQILPTPRAALWARWLAQAHDSWVRFRQSL